MLDHLEILQWYHSDAAEPARRAVRFATRTAAELGATTSRKGDAPERGFGFYDVDEAQTRTDPLAWALAAPPDTLRVVLVAGEDHVDLGEGASVVSVAMEPWHTEETLFAESGIATLLGDPEREPLVPSANFGAHTIGYAAFAALAGIAARWRRFGKGDSATVDGPGVLAWVNWKAAVSASLGREMNRRGHRAEWPIVTCADGEIALVYTERDWQPLVELVGDPQLEEGRFATFQGRAENRDAYLAILRKWCRRRTKSELMQLFLEHAIPAAPVSTVFDLPHDPLLRHRESFQVREDGVRLVRPPHRIAAEAQGAAEPAGESSGDLPLAGIRVLDFGIITAGAGVSALLADLGAEVIKVESHTRADPFRRWAGDDDSPVFKSNNRNKLGLALDLKTKEGKERFLELAQSADIVLENYRRGVLDRLGLSFDTLRSANPNILLASISSQGLDGPGASHTTFGSTLEASSGFASLTTYEDGEPVISGRNLNYPDQIVCLYGAAMVALAVTDCRRRGVALHLDVSQRDCAVYQLGDAIAAVAQGGSSSEVGLQQAVGRPALARLYRCGCGGYVALSDPEATVAAAIDDLDSLDDETVAAWTSQRPAEEAVAQFLAAGGGAAIAQAGSHILRARRYLDAEIFSSSPNGALVKGFPFQFREHAMTIWGNSPDVGEHNDRILAELS